jgi:uncharacterized glyoxalase superfamily protein PhnB
VETFRTAITPVLTVRQAARAVAFYQAAFGAEEVYRNTYPDGRIVDVAPIADQSYGLRQGRLADPFGHHWLVGRPLARDRGDWARTPDR